MSSDTKMLLTLLLILSAIGAHRISPCAAYVLVALLCVMAYALVNWSQRP